MKNLCFLLVWLLSVFNVAIAQVGINHDSTSPDPSAMLDVKSSTKGMLVPRMSQTEIEAIASPANGLLVFCTTSNKFFAYLSGINKWKEIAYGPGTINPGGGWYCGDPVIINHLIVNGVAPVDKSVSYGTVTNIPGESAKCWITQNLGSSQQATDLDDVSEASAGWYWQFNRMQGFKHDGITRTPNTVWISSIDENLNWQAANDPCSVELGVDWRVPIASEWGNVDAIGNWTTWTDPWNSSLKMHAAGYLQASNGSLLSRGTEGFYRSSTQYNTGVGYYLHFYNNESFLYVSYFKANGFSLRCIKDETSQASLPSVSTASITNITTISASGGGNVTSDGGAMITERGVCWSTMTNPTIADFKTIDGAGNGEFISSLTGLVPNTEYFARAYATNSVGTAYGDQVNFTTIPENPNLVTDIDGNVYQTVTLGTQTWMAENLKVTRYRNGTSIEYPGSNITAWQSNSTGAYAWYNNDIAWKNIYGALYNWYALVNPDGLCPEGWHVPSDEEWSTLSTFAGGEGVAGGKLKSTRTDPDTHPRWDNPNISATDEYGFAAFPGGYREDYGSFFFVGYYGYWWSNSTNWAAGPAFAYYRNMVHNQGYIYRDSYNKLAGFSVRCVKD